MLFLRIGRAIMKVLSVAEKPSVAKGIAMVLSGGRMSLVRIFPVVIARFLDLVPYSRIIFIEKGPS